MTILQGGVPKCGNFWLWQIIQQVLERTGQDTTGFIEQQPIYELAKKWELNFPEQARIDVLDIDDLQYSYRISSIFRMPIDDIGVYIAKANHVWTHSPICNRSGELFDLFEKKVYIIRDPRDRAISAAKYFCSPYMLKYYPQEETNHEKFLEKNFAKLMHEWVWHVWDHLRMSRQHDIHIAFYEGLVMNFQQELGRLLNYLQVQIPQHRLEELEEAVSFSALKKKNPKHLQKGTAGYWKDVLNPEQIKQAETMAGALLRYLGYPISANEPMSYSTELSDIDFEEMKQVLVKGMPF